MDNIVTVPLTRISPLGDGRITALTNSVALVTDPRQWAYSAEVDFEISGNQNDCRVMKICVEVESGVLGVGLLREDGEAWIVRAAATEGPTANEVSLQIPAQIRRGKLIFDNWTEGGQPARGVIRTIKIVREYVWPAFGVVLAKHQEQITEHGGSLGLRKGDGQLLLYDALRRPLHYVCFGNDPNIALLAAVLGHRLVTYRPFVDGNKRLSLVVTKLFLELNGYELMADDAEAVTTWLALAEGNLDAKALAAWIRERIKAR